MSRRIALSVVSLSATRLSVVALITGFVVTGCAIVDPNEQTRQTEQARAQAERERLAKESLQRQQRDEQARRLAQERAKPRVAPELANALQVGRYNCELKRQVNILSKLPDNSGVTLRWQRQDYKMLAVQSNTGAVRLENEASGLVWITIVGKSMLFDSKRGRQLANECRL